MSLLNFWLNAEIDAALDAIREHRARLRQPAKSQSEYIDMLMNKLHMPRTAQTLGALASRF